jgi:hypothetical protein
VTSRPINRAMHRAIHSPINRAMNIEKTRREEKWPFVWITSLIFVFRTDGDRDTGRHIEDADG